MAILLLEIAVKEQDSFWDNYAFLHLGYAYRCEKKRGLESNNWIEA